MLDCCHVPSRCAAAAAVVAATGAAAVASIGDALPKAVLPGDQPKSKRFSVITARLVLPGLQFRFGDKLLHIEWFCPQNRTAVLKGLTENSCVNRVQKATLPFPSPPIYPPRPPPRKRDLVGCSSPFRRLAELFTALHAWCKQCLSGR